MCIRDRVSDMTTAKCATLILGPKSGPSAPVVGDGADMSKGYGKGVTGNVFIGIKNPGNSIRGGIRTQESIYFIANKRAKTKLRAIGNKAFINIPLRKGVVIVDNRKVGSLVILIGIADSLNRGSTGELIIKISQNNINTFCCNFLPINGRLRASQSNNH